MGLFITFEGPDGSGKSTQARLLAESLRRRGHDVVETREPGGTAVGEELRTLLLDPASPPADALAMALMYSAARAQLIGDVIRPAIAAGQTVIADRYADSTMAYQGYGLGVSLDRIAALRKVVTGGLEPDAIVYVDIEPEAGGERMRARGGRNLLDALDLEFHRRVRAGYLEMIGQDPTRWVVVCGNAPAEVVHTEITEKLDALLHLSKE